MAERTGIEWTDSTWNPVRGCSRVSEGCRHCYAELVAARFSGPRQTFEGYARRGFSGEPHWTGKVALVEKRLADPLRWKEPRRIFVNSMSDLFHKNLPDEVIDQVFAVMALASRHTFQVLTKRPERMRAYMADPARKDRVCDVIERDHSPEPVKAIVGPGASASCTYRFRRERLAWPPSNVWLGVSAEDQATAYERIPYLLDTPAAVRFVSAEPLLGPIDFRPRRQSDLCIRCGEGPAAAHNHPDGYRTRGLDWVIVGGESGPGARPMHPAWARGIRDQCAHAGVAFFFKQWGAYAPIDVEDGDDPDGVCVFALPDGTVTDLEWNGGPGPHLKGAQRLVRSSKACQREWMAAQAGIVPVPAGALLDGRVHHELPRATT